MGFFARGIAIVATAAALTSAPVQASTMEAVFTGTVGGSFDKTGLFGPPGDRLDLLPFILTYVYDTSAGLRTGGGPGTSDDVRGGTSTPDASPTLSVTLQINFTNPQTILGSHFSRYLLCDFDFCPEDQYSAFARDYSTDGGSVTDNYISASFFDNVEFLPDNLDTPFSTDIGIRNFADFYFMTYDALTFEYSVQTFGSLSLEHVTVREIGAAPVPLPASGLLLLGASLGLLSLRRKAKRAA